MHAWGLRLRRVRRVLALARPPVLPSALLNDVGTPVAIISQLNTLPACAPVNASMAAARLATHDSGPGWIATPFLYDSFIHNSTPVYPGALSSLLGDYTLPVAPVPIRGLFSRPTTRTAGRQSGAMGNPRLAARISWTVTEIATRT